MATITPEQEQAIRNYLHGRHIPSGLGNKDEACSIAAINIALSGHLTDGIPFCMSPVIGRWIIVIQDNMPDVMRNSDAWRELLPLAAGTGRDREEGRLALIMKWMWTIVLPVIQPVANTHGFGTEWATMLTQRTETAADITAAAAWAAAAAWVADAEAGAAAAAAAAAAGAAARAARAAGAETAGAAAEAAVAGAVWAAADAEAAAEAAETKPATVANDPWRTFDPPGLLRNLIEAKPS